MTVSTQKLQIIDLLFPVLETALECVCGAMPCLSGAVDVVNLKNAKIGYAAVFALAAKQLHDLQLLSVMMRLAAKVVVVLIPERHAAGIAAIGEITRSAARFALRVSRPSRGDVAGSTAVLSPSPLNNMIRWRERLAAMFTLKRLSLFAHCRIISETSNPDYCEIARKRIMQQLLPFGETA